MEEAARKLSSIPAPDPDAIPPQIRNSDEDCSDRKPGEPRLVGPAPYDSDDVAVAECKSIDYTIKVPALDLYYLLFSSIELWYPECLLGLLSFRVEDACGSSILCRAY